MLSFDSDSISTCLRVNIYVIYKKLFNEIKNIPVIFVWTPSCMSDGTDMLVQETDKANVLYLKENSLL
jgi:hypothetical protein